MRDIVDVVARYRFLYRDRSDKLGIFRSVAPDVRRILDLPAMACRGCAGEAVRRSSVDTPQSPAGERQSFGHPRPWSTARRGGDELWGAG
ncbi:MAG: hypothetical protein KDH15_17950 [Rhodocyclaceae bacterium]|nr:hypothetical protein [Rhodocyclaceae bacterium]